MKANPDPGLFSCQAALELISAVNMDWVADIATVGPLWVQKVILDSRSVNANLA